MTSDELFVAANDFDSSRPSDAEKSTIFSAIFSEPQTPAYLTYFNDPLYLLILPYILIQPWLKSYVARTNIYEKHKPFWKTFMGVYNLILSLFSFSSFAAVFYWFLTTGISSQGVFRIGIFQKSTTGTGTQLPFVYNCCWYFYISKYVEFLDTFFLILCGRPVTWLQYFHHI